VTASAAASWSTTGEQKNGAVVRSTRYSEHPMAEPSRKGSGGPVSDVPKKTEANQVAIGRNVDNHPCFR